MAEAALQAILLHMAIYLTAAVIAVPLSRYLGFGSALGYLGAGVVIGPVLGLVGSEAEDVQHFAEYGVVLMLFLVGLELRPKVLWDMRHRLLGLGGLQVGLSIFAIAVVCWRGFGMSWNAALAVGMALSLSSTAIVLQMLTERKLAHTEGGRASLAVLLFQDVAALPLLALIPLLAFGPTPAGVHGVDTLALTPEARAAAVAGLGLLVVLAGRFLISPVYRVLARSRVPEIQVAGALLFVVAISLGASYLGISPALGSFLAGVVLAGSEYRHSLEADLGPFKGLLLGLFFMTVGASVDVARLMQEPAQAIGLTLLLVAVKAALLWPLGGLFKLRGRSRTLFALALAPAGEFAFVLLGMADRMRLLSIEQSETVLLVITLSMLALPPLLRLQAHLDRSAAARKHPAHDEVAEPGSVIIAGMGRVGQVVNRIVNGVGHRAVVLDSQPDTVERLRALGIESYYGEVDRAEVLASAGLGEARAIVIAIDQPDQAVRMVRHIRRLHPEMPIIARARDRHQVYALTRAGATATVREVFPAAVEVARETLLALGHRPHEVDGILAEFVGRDQQMLEELARLWRDDVPVSRNRGYLETERRQGAAIEAALRRRSAADEQAARP